MPVLYNCYKTVCTKTIFKTFLFLTASAYVFLWILVTLAVTLIMQTYTEEPSFKWKKLIKTQVSQA